MNSLEWEQDLYGNTQQSHFYTVHSVFTLYPLGTFPEDGSTSRTCVDPFSL
jgi:hypothetical protein